MGRRVGIVGAGLMVVGVLMQSWWFRMPPRVDQNGPLDGVVNDLLHFVPTFGTLCATAGAVMLALGVLIGVTGQLPVPRPFPTLLGVGLGLVVLVAGLDYFLLADGVLFRTTQQLPMRLVLAVSSGLALLQLVGSALVGLWLTGLVTGPRQSASRIRHDAPLAPSRPF